MQKLSLKTYTNGIELITLNDKAEQLLADLGNETEVKSNKHALFGVLHGIAEMAITLLPNKNNPGDEVKPYLSADLLQGIYVLDQLYQFLDNLEYKTKM